MVTVSQGIARSFSSKTNSSIKNFLVTKAVKYVRSFVLSLSAIVGLARFRVPTRIEAGETLLTECSSPCLGDRFVTRDTNTQRVQIHAVQNQETLTENTQAHQNARLKTARTSHIVTRHTRAAAASSQRRNFGQHRVDAAGCAGSSSSMQHQAGNSRTALFAALLLSATTPCSLC